MTRIEPQAGAGWAGMKPALAAATLHGMKLLGRLTSINVRKVMWTATLLGLELEREDWGAGFRSPQEPGYLALNPNGLIPVLLVFFVLQRYLVAGIAATGLKG